MTPVGVPTGLRSRAGNSMGRARAAALEATLDLLAAEGMHGVTMIAVADRATIARATLYNHFRDRAELLEAVLVDEVERAAEVARAGSGPQQRLRLLVDHVATHAALAGLRRHDPAVLARLLGEGGAPELRARARQRVATLVEGLDPDLVLRWLETYALAPGEPESRHAQASWLTGAAAPPPPQQPSGGPGSE